jgi:hypothetical protein
MTLLRYITNHVALHVAQAVRYMVSLKGRDHHVAQDSRRREPSRLLGRPVLGRAGRASQGALVALQWQREHGGTTWGRKSLSTKPGQVAPGPPAGKSATQAAAMTGGSATYGREMRPKGGRDLRGCARPVHDLNSQAALAGVCRTQPRRVANPKAGR